MGGMAALAVLIFLAPGSPGAGQIGLIRALAEIAGRLVGPAMVLTVISGLLAMAVNPAFYDLGWVWLKAASGILILEGGLHILGPLQEEAKRAVTALTKGPDPASLAQLFKAESDTLWVLLAVSAANIALAVWRPRLSNIPL